MISVIMASYLGNYPGCASNREFKLRRAIDSFLIQNIGELIVVSDGCDKTINIVNEYDNSSIKLVSIPKQELFSGKVREAGIAIAQYDWVCYLDSDDEFKPNHLQVLLSHINESYDWFYYDDYFSNGTKRIAEVALCRIGTSHIFHKKRINGAVWPDGNLHDWGFISQLGTNYKKVEHTGYIVHHMPGKLDT